MMKRDDFGAAFWLGWFGVIAGSMSAISAITRIFDVGLRQFLMDFVRYYRNILAPLHSLINLLPLPFEIPLLAIDLSALYLVLLTLSFRTERAIQQIVDADYLWRLLDRFPFARAPIRRLSIPVRKSLNDVVGMSYITLLCPIWRLWPVKWLTAVRQTGEGPLATELDREANKPLQRRFQQILAQMFALPIFVVFFFLLNAYGPV